ncbi:hypothetical protein D9V86_10425 [Bacteroidetes/Chlorobi group bacterium ChocPot_Mid]|jgi:hypothetical protein|nr:MAG: hypothetical protein D9V86_10425 [Bacteroidetes/Chlorobi group bacterium ChocPot_Mid]
MKLNEVYDEMLDIAKKIGVTVRKENGKFKGGNCTINNEEVILINNSIPLETRTSILAKCLTNYSINNIFMKPAVRDYIEQEQYKREKSNNDDFQLIIDN